MEVLGKVGCTSCQKAEAMLGEHGVAFERRDLFKSPLTVDELTSVLERHGLTPHDVLSTRSRPYRQLNLAEQDLSDEQLLDLMGRYPALIRRPLVITDDDIVIGFDRSGLSRLLGGV